MENNEDSRLRAIIGRLSESLPAQGPIGIFIHHNTLHAFEALPFEEAVVAAGEKFSCEPFLPEDELRAELRTGRITDRDLESVLRLELGPAGERFVIAGISRYELRRRIAKYGIPEASGYALDWLLNETPAITRLRDDLPSDARETVGCAQALWAACLSSVKRSPPDRKITSPIKRTTRFRDLLSASCGVDTDAWVDPAFIRVLGAFLDQGLARWTLPERQRGLYACALHYYSHPWSSHLGRWAASLPALMEDDLRHARSPVGSVRHSLTALGVDAEEHEDYLEATALALRGWAGMVRQLELRPDRVPARFLPASLTDYLAVRLLFERAALAYAAARLPGFRGGLAELRTHLRASRTPEPEPSAEERAWPLFHTAQLCGLSAEETDGFSAEQVAVWETEIRGFGGIDRRRILHAAYERHLRSRLCDALTGHVVTVRVQAPSFQTILCIDEREESFRRHLEEAMPDVETLGTAGYFGVAMYYQGATDARPRPLCPIAIKPTHYVGEVKTTPWTASVPWRRPRRREAGLIGRAVHLGSGTVLGGALITTLLGPLAVLPLVLRVVFPGLLRRWRAAFPLTAPSTARLALDRRSSPPPIGIHNGYTKEEMAAIVGGLLRSLGIQDRLSPIVVVMGHGSSSLNNPHESAHDCGACGGGRGGPNARAFSQMANDPVVRGLLAKEGIHVPVQTWFIGGQHNTCDNSVEFFDLDLLPKEFENRFNPIAKAFSRAKRREAHERCRRFETATDCERPGAALVHVESRANDLAQPRPEYGHASNAFCVIGRRSRTQGLFLDRRAFLTSYDPTRDEYGSILEGTLSSVVPVVAGISLEYYFGRVDPTGYGSGTKLPHNVACLLGVMDGAQSDLRTGLPWQMVEIHEPVRLFIVVECRRDLFDRVLERQPVLRGQLDKRWFFAACLDPESNALWLREKNGYVPWTPERPLSYVSGGSAACFQDKRGHLPIVKISR